MSTSNGMVCENTPCSLKMSRKSQFVATISKPGYKTTTVSVTNHIGTGGGVGMAGNVVLGGLIGAGVDVASGAMLDLTPNPAIVTLERDETGMMPYAPPVLQPPPASTSTPPSASAPAAAGSAAPGEDADVEAFVSIQMSGQA